MVSILRWLRRQQIGGKLDGVSESWAADALTELQRGRGKDGWGYRPMAPASTEPSALATIALASAGASEAGATADWLARIQEPNGSVGISGTRAEPRWPTALAFLAWAAVDVNAAGRQKAIEWLLLEKGKSIPLVPAEPRGHDSTIIGWPWVENTHSWVEPTGLAMLALRRNKTFDNERYRDGLRLLRDRALPTRGGWNAGNTFAYGTELRPQAVPTGVALLALATTQKSDAMIDRACVYLEKLLPETRAPMSLGWGLLGLMAWGRRPEKADTWLAESFEQYRDKDSLHFHAALLLLAGSPKSLPYLGVDS